MDPDTIWNAIFGQESNYGTNNRTSVTGAVGPGQIQPQTFAQYAAPGENINNPTDNISVSKRIVQDYYNRFNGDPGRIATAYFSGPNNVAPANSPTPYIQDRSDPTGKRTSAYVSDISNRVNAMTTPDLLGSWGAQTPTQAHQEAPDDLLGKWQPPLAPVVAQSQSGSPPVSAIMGSGVPYGALHGLSNIISTGGKAAQIEMGQPVNVPDTEGTFNALQSNATGQLPTGTALGRSFGEMLPYAAALPSGAGPISRLIQAALSAGGSTAAGALTNNNPAAELAGGILTPFAAAKIPSIAGNTLAGITGMTTGAGENAVKGAFSAGAAGGEQGAAFRTNLTGDADVNQVISDAKSAVTNMRLARSQQYQQSMAGVSSDPTVLSFNDIDKAMNKANSIKTFSGQSGNAPTQNLQKSTQGVQQDINDTINHWKQLDPNEFHTPSGMDALKQQLGDIKDNLPYNTPQRTVAEQAYNAVRGTIVKQAPEYADAMSSYSKASDDIDQAVKTFSLGNASKDTTLRKLQSVMRSNVNTNYGQRASVADTLQQNGAPNLTASLSGQALQSVMPRGLARLSALELPGAAAAMWQGDPKIALGMLAATPFQSPRIVGEGAYRLGQLSRFLPQSTPTLPGAAAFALSKSNQLNNLVPQ